MVCGPPGRNVFLGVSTTFIDNYSSPHDGGDFCGPRIGCVWKQGIPIPLGSN